MGMLLSSAGGRRRVCSEILKKKLAEEGRGKDLPQVPAIWCWQNALSGHISDSDPSTRIVNPSKTIPFAQERSLLLGHVQNKLLHSEPPSHAVGIRIDHWFFLSRWGGTK